MHLPRPTGSDSYSLPDPSELVADETDLLSLLTTTVALFGLGLTSLLSLLGLMAG